MDHYTRMRRVAVRMTVRFGTVSMERAMKTNQTRQGDIMGALPPSGCLTPRVAAQIEALRRLHESRLAYRAALDGAALDGAAA